MNRTTHEWIVSGPAFCRPQVDRTSNRPTTTTSGVGQPVEDPGPTSTPSTAPYAPSIPVPRDLCPCGFEIQAGLIPRMIRDLPNLLQGTPNPSADAIEQAWSYACDFARSKEIRNEADVVGFWGFLLSGLSRTCQVLGVPASAHRENVDTMVNVRMDIAMESSGQRRVAIVLKRDSVVIACRRGWSDLVGKEWLGWNGRAVVTGAKSVIIKVCHLVPSGLTIALTISVLTVPARVVDGGGGSSMGTCGHRPALQGRLAHAASRWRSEVPLHRHERGVLAGLIRSVAFADPFVHVPPSATDRTRWSAGTAYRCCPVQ